MSTNHLKPCVFPVLLPLVLASFLAPTGTLGQVLTPAQKIETLDIHNQLRRLVYPQGADINYLTWNTRLENLAQRAANSCIFEHNYGGDYANLGENLYQGFRTNTTEIVTFFFMENLAFDYNKKSCPLPNMFNFRTCGHYFQLVGSTLAEVGCAIATCGENKYLFVCEYDKMYPSNIYTAGTPCSACPQSAGYCLRGLCINGTMTRDADILNRQGNASCSIVCKNCGVLVDNRSSSPPVCACTCPAGFGGADCSSKSAGSQLPAGCTNCAAQATPCQNGGWETGGNATCSCQCPANFTGPQCQLSTLVYANAVQLKLRGGTEFCTSGKCAKLPVDSRIFLQSVWPTLRSALASGVNRYCNSSSNSFSQCCPSSAARPSGSAITGTLLSDGDISYVDFALKNSASGDLEVVVYAVPSSANSLCASGSVTRRRKKRTVTAGSSAVSASVLAASVSSANASISSSLASCCSGLAVASVGDFKSVADAMYGYSGAGQVQTERWTALAICFVQIVEALMSISFD